MKRGTFIALEGLDGSGTSTQTAALAAALRFRGHTVVETNQPSPRFLGVQVRALLRRKDPPADPHTLALLFAADRLDHVHELIEPALSRNEIVLCDRYVMSSWAYQSLSCDPAWVETINARAPWPDLTFMLEVDAAEASRRVLARTPEDERDVFETETIQRRVEANYDIALERDLEGVVRVDGTASVDAVTAALLQACIDRGL